MREQRKQGVLRHRVQSCASVLAVCLVFYVVAFLFVPSAPSAACWMSRLGMSCGWNTVLEIRTARAV